MPSIFKTLASITVWILFIFGILSLFGGLFRIFGGGDKTVRLISSYFGYGILSLTLSVVCAKLRQTMG